MNRKWITITSIIAIALGAYIFSVSGGNGERIETEDVKQLVQDYSTRQVTAENASITSEQLIVTESDDNQLTYELPEDEFFVSIAPYVNNTHPCAIHSLTGCQGEMVEEEFDVYIEDTEGNVIVDETLTSLSNGFIDLWLPRDKNYQVTIEHDDRVVESELSTFENDNTCVTTMQLTEKKRA
ncbi:CueP family metal-binding protein [Aquibacillus koreensis]|uniref:CueP family metal-binding protein n=1 Tax=Aquibacillus koreensis TaxID=279446 RepID=A0A9X4AIC9_9BACI|nr:CueP family metal-binding protein [Aquibacillus koreensis]MCT2535168.1 CueP family metal-binding protein [Aquibacillus koreensis]MDC3421027.1 CueP family metal-binding protein [Aquibacillus koreensis]